MFLHLAFRMPWQLECKYMNDVSFYFDGNIEIVTGAGMHNFPYHTHNSFMAGAVLAGCGEFDIGGKTLELRKGDAYIVPSNTGIAINPTSGFSYITICLKNELAEVMKEYKTERCFYPSLGGKLLELANNFRMHDIDERAFEMRIIDMFELYKASDSVRSIYTEKAARYLNEHCQSKFSLDELAENVCVSKYHLIRTFKKEMGITPKQYHQQCKVRKIKDMALKISQSDIAYELDFTSQSHMNDIFKKYMGITAGSYSSAVENKEQ